MLTLQIKQQEETAMKNAICHIGHNMQNTIPYPNAMTQRQIFNRLLDAALVAASGIGLAACVMLMLVLA